jgi:predicted ribosome quality control (RQC) complex YloA/Tae2 family protein
MIVAMTRSRVSRALGLVWSKHGQTIRSTNTKYIASSTISHDLQHSSERQNLCDNFPKTFFSPKRKMTTTIIFMSAMEDVETDDLTQQQQEQTFDLDRTWNLGGLRKEVSRLTVRCHKKIGKASQRLLKAQEEVNRLTSTEDVSMEDLESCPNVEEISAQVDELQNRLKQLNRLEVLLQDIKGKRIVLPEHIAQLAFDLQVDDEPPKVQEGGQKKQKGPKNMASFRRPYRRYYTKNKTEIRVGKQAQDNDELTLSPEHRDGLDWWMQ